MLAQDVLPPILRGAKQKIHPRFGWLGFSAGFETYAFVRGNWLFRSLRTKGGTLPRRFAFGESRGPDFQLRWNVGIALLRLRQSAFAFGFAGPGVVPKRKFWNEAWVPALRRVCF